MQLLTIIISKIIEYNVIDYQRRARLEFEESNATIIYSRNLWKNH